MRDGCGASMSTFPGSVARNSYPSLFKISASVPKLLMSYCLLSMLMWLLSGEALKQVSWNDLCVKNANTTHMWPMKLISYSLLLAQNVYFHC